MKPELSIIMPAYNEAELIGTSLIKLNDYLAKEMSDIKTEVIVVINSPASDGTLAAAEQATAKLKASKNHQFIVHDAKKRLGKGGAVKLGMHLASGDYKLFMDTDLSTPVWHIEPALSLIKKGEADILIGVRDIDTMHKTFLRKISSQASNLAVRMLLLPGFKDTQCGFKMFKASAAELIFKKLESTGWSFDVEALVIARQNHLKIIQMPIVDWADPKDEGLTGDNQIAVMAKELRSLLRFSFNRISGKYK